MFVLLLVLLPVAMAATHTKPIAVAAPTYTVDLDAAPRARWAFLETPQWRRDAQFAAKYFGQYLSGALADAVEFLAVQIEAMYGKEFAEEMAGASDALDMDHGLLVLLNFLYELRGLNGSQPDTTGGRLPPHKREFQSGACTSAVVGTPSNGVFHARNLDWNLPGELRNMTFECVWTKNKVEVARGACFAGYMGLLTAMKQNAFGISLDERDKGGNVLVDGFTGLLRGGKPVTHAIREAVLSSDTYSEIVAKMSSVQLAAPAYFIISGTTEKEGIILSRDRLAKSDRVPPLSLGQRTPGWYLLQTNYDWTVPPPSVDNRRIWGYYFMDQYGSLKNFTSHDNTEENLNRVTTTWPVYNEYTSQHVMINAKKGIFKVFAVYADGLPPGPKNAI